MERVGVLAGIGQLPVECAKAAKAQGHEVYAVALLPETEPALRDYADDYQQISVFKVGRILSYLKKNKVTQVTMIGKVTKELLYAHKAMPDFKTMQILMKLPDRRDDTVMEALVAAVESTGAKVVDQTALIRPLMPSAGVLTRRKPTTEEKQDMEFGFRMAKEIGRMDVGQTVVVKYGGNAMLNEELKSAVMQDIVLLNTIGVHVVLVHGGGPEINAMLELMVPAPAMPIFIGFIFPPVQTN